jgi:hypothetical protein
LHFEISQESEDDLDEDAAVGDVTSHPDADTTIIFVTAEG